jgi:hypothetical protein
VRETSVQAWQCLELRPRERDICPDVAAPRTPRERDICPGVAVPRTPRERDICPGVAVPSTPALRGVYPGVAAQRGMMTDKNESSIKEL